MEVKAEEMIRDVRVAMDMNREDKMLEGAVDSDTLELDELIESTLCGAIDRVHMMAPHRLLESERLDIIGEISADRLKAGNTSENIGGWDDLPKDFLRLVVFMVNSWRRPVYEAIYEDDPRYVLQKSRWKGISGTEDKPVVALSNRSNGLRIEYYPAKEGDIITSAGYVSRASIDEEGKIRVSERCYRGSVYMSAGMSYLLLGEAEKSAQMVSLCESVLM